ncbi:MAG: hypothetical protein V4724_39740 [Pseudomonadota bacterium]
MQRLIKRLYKFNNIFAGLVLLAALVCIPRFTWALLGYLAHDSAQNYYRREVGAWGIFMLPAMAYGIYWGIFDKRRTDEKIRAAKPFGFITGYEIRQGDKYFAISSDRTTIVIVDMAREFAEHKSIEFLQSFIIQEANIQSTLTLKFNSFEFSSMHFSVRTNASADIAAKLNYAAWS